MQQRRPDRLGRRLGVVATTVAALMLWGLHPAFAAGDVQTIIPIQQFTVTPSTRLVDDQLVSVEWSNIIPSPTDVSLAIRECAPGAFDTAHCSTLAFVDPTTSGTDTVNVLRSVGTGAYRCPADGSSVPCLVVLTTLTEGVTFGVYANAPITFAPK